MIQMGLWLLLAVLTAAPARAAPPDAATLEIYKTKCSTCHMPDGNAPLELMNLADRTWKHGSRPADITKVIAEGVPNSAMLPFKSQLTKEEIAKLAAYVRSFDKSLKAKAPAGANKKTKAAS